MEYQVKVAKKRPYWIDSVEDRPSYYGFLSWKSSYFLPETPPEINLKFNFLNIETLEWVSSSNVPYDGYYFEISIPQGEQQLPFTYYYYVSRIEILGNGFKKYTLTLDHWTSFSLKILNHWLTNYQQFANKVFLKRGHYHQPYFTGYNTWRYPDERLEAAYIPTGRIVKNVIGNDSALRLEFINRTSSFEDPEMINLVYCFHNDDVKTPFRFYPLINTGTRVSYIRILQDGTNIDVRIDNNQETINQLISRTGTGPNVSKFKGIFAAPNINLFHIVRDTTSIRGKTILYFEMDQFISQPTHVINTGPFIQANSNFTDKPVITPFHQDYWKLNEVRYIKSLKILDVLNYRLYGSRFDISKCLYMWNERNINGIPNLMPKIEYYRLICQYKVIFSGGFHCLISNNRYYDPNSTINNLVLEDVNDRYNYTNRVLSLPLELPSTTSEYLQYVNSVKNTTNTGFNNFKKETIISGTKTAFSDLFTMTSSAANSFGGPNPLGFISGISSIGKGISNIGLGITSSIIRVKNKEKLIKANFKDKQNSSALSVHTSNIEDVLNGYYMNDIGSEIPWSSKGLIDVNLISDEMTDNILMSLNNVIVKYGYVTNSYIQLDYLNNNYLRSYPFFWLELDGEQLLEQYYSKLSEDLQEKINHKYIIEFIETISNGIRLWNRDFGYEYLS